MAVSICRGTAYGRQAGSGRGMRVERGTIVVRAVWDAEADVFVATSSDVPGLVAEGATFQELQAKLSVLIPELLELNGGPATADGDAAYLEEVPLVLMSEQVMKICLRAHG